MSKIINFEDARARDTDMAELICVRCAKRWYVPFGEFARLEDVECVGCGIPGGVITTGQVIPADVGSQFEG